MFQYIKSMEDRFRLTCCVSPEEHDRPRSFGGKLALTSSTLRLAQHFCVGVARPRPCRTSNGAVIEVALTELSGHFGCLVIN